MNSTDTASFTIVVSNATGAGTAYGVVLSDPLPGGLPWTTDAGTFSNGTLSDTIGNLAAGSSVTIHVNAVTPSGYKGTLNNTATATPTNGSAASGSATDVVQATTLSVTETGNGTVNSTDTVAFTIVVSNATGAGTAYGVVLSDPLPGGLAWTTDAGTFSNGTLSDTIGNMAAGSSVTIQVNAPTASGYSATLNNTATATPTNGSAASGSATDVVQAPSLSVTETGNGTVNSTDTASFTITVSNMAGAGTAYGVGLSDTLPGGLAWTSVGGAISNGTLTDTIGNLAAGSSVTIHVNAVTPSGYSATLNNTATATPTNGSAASGSATDTVLAPEPERDRDGQRHGELERHDELHDHRQQRDGRRHGLRRGPERSLARLGPPELEQHRRHDQRRDADRCHRQPAGGQERHDHRQRPHAVGL